MPNIIGNLAQLSDQKFEEIFGELPSEFSDNDRDAFRHAFSAGCVSLFASPIVSHALGGANESLSFIHNDL
jgi:hypothetical protein